MAGMDGIMNDIVAEIRPSRSADGALDRGAGDRRVSEGGRMSSLPRTGSASSRSPGW